MDCDFHILRWLEETESDVSIHGDNELLPEILSNSDSEPELQNIVTESEQSGDETTINDVDLVPLAQPTVSQEAAPERNRNVTASVYTGKDNFTKWYVHNPVSRVTRTARQNIITRLPGIKNAARGLNNCLESWSFYFPEDLIDEIVRCTNQHLEIMSRAYSRGVRDIPQTDNLEMKAFFGVLYMAGVKKGNHINLDELWKDDGTAPDFFSAVMPKRRFQTLVQAIRFDDKTTRNVRKNEDNLAPIRNIFDRFVQSCSDAYTISECGTIDEMLEAFRGRCKFRVYIPNKPAKYGIKIYALCDSRTFYTAKLEVYTGKQPNGPYCLPNDATSVVMRLIEPIDGTGRNVTMDNYFTSVPLANDLFTNHRLTIVGTVRKNKPQLPTELTNITGRPENSSMFAFGKEPNRCLLTSYVPKKGKNVLLISTMHKDDTIDDMVGKPEVIMYYNVSKGGVDVVDRLKSEYDVSRISNRWPLTLFFALLNIGGINAQILYNGNTQINITRRLFLTQLAQALVRPHLERRVSLTNLSVGLKQKIRRVAQLPPPPPTPRQNNEKQRCAFCPLRKNRFSQHYCHTCSSAICKEHTGKTILTCQQCKDIEERVD